MVERSRFQTFAARLLPERLLADPRPAPPALASAAWQVHPGSHHTAWRRLSALLAFVALG